MFLFGLQGALTHGDRRATETRDLSQFNIDNKVIVLLLVDTLKVAHRIRKVTCRICKVARRTRKVAYKIHKVTCRICNFRNGVQDSRSGTQDSQSGTEFVKFVQDSQSGAPYSQSGTPYSQSGTPDSQSGTPDSQLFLYLVIKSFQNSIHSCLIMQFYYAFDSDEWKCLYFCFSMEYLHSTL